MDTHGVDYAIFVVILVVSIGMGFFHAWRARKKKDTTNEFLMGDRKMGTVPVAVSIFASVVSGTIFLGYPVEMYTRGTQFSIGVVGLALSWVFSAFTFVPLFYRLRVISVFEYLDARFQSKYVRLYGSIITLLIMTLHSGVALYGPSVAFQVTNGFPVWLSIVISSTVTLVYTTLGGMKAVVYTDVFHASCMFAGIIAILVQGTREVGSFSRVLELSDRDGRIQFFNFDPNPTLRTSFWINVIGSSFTSFTISQPTIQRTCSLSSLTKAKWSMVMNAVLILLNNMLLVSVGLVIYAYYANIECDPLQAKLIANQNQLVPYFIRNCLNYPGISGALFGILFGGTLSTVSSNLNSSAAIVWQDILKHFFEHLSETRKTLITKILIIIFGIISTAVAFAARNVHGHVFQMVITFLSTFSGPMLGVFLLGALFPFANSKGALTGGVVATGFSAWIVMGSLIYNPHDKTLPTSVEKCNATNGTFPSPRNYTYFLRGHDESPSISFSTDGINESVLLMNWTPAPPSENRESKSYSSPLIRLYSISVYLISFVGTVNCVVIGLIVSLFTGGRRQLKPDASLMIPLFDRICCYLPDCIRRHLRCGIEYRENESASTENVPPKEGAVYDGSTTDKPIETSNDRL